MKLSEIAKALNAKVICGEDRLDEEQDKVFASDLMSDILTLGDNFPMIVTGLCTMQTIRTCEMGSPRSHALNQRALAATASSRPACCHSSSTVT